MATIAAMYDGLNDASTGRSAYFRTILTDPAKRMGRLREGLISTSRVLLLRGPIARIAHWWRSDASADEMR